MKKVFSAIMVFVMVLSVFPAGIITAWATDTYTVYFDDDSFEVTVSPASKTVTYGSTYGTLPNPSGSGYSFDGWYTGRNGAGTRILSSSTVTMNSSHTLYAKWHWGGTPLSSGGFSYIPATGGKAQIVGISGTSGSQVTIPSTIGGYTVTSIGHYLYGGIIDYYPFSNSPATVIFPSTITSIGSDSFFMIDTSMTLCFLGNAPSMADTPPSGSIVYYLAGRTGYSTPIWSGCPCYSFEGVNITFDANGGMCVIGSTLMVPGLMLSAPTVTKTGYTVTGWSPTLPATVPAVDTTYTAQWSAKTITVTFEPWNGTVTPTTSTVTYGSTYGVGTGGWPTPMRTGYTFAGWYTGPDGAGINILSNTTVTITSSRQTLYAKWTPVTTVTITFDVNGGTGGTGPTAMTPGAELTAPTVARTGYTFSGWTPTVPSTVPAVDTTYVAQWSANAYTVTYDPQGGTVSPTTSTVTYGNTYGAGTGGFPTPTRTGYVFNGWYTSSPFETEILSTTTVTVTTSQTLYAHWLTESAVFNYTIANGQATITKFNGSGGNVTIPALLGGYPVTEIGTYAFEAKVLITHLVIPDSVISIDDSAFVNCGGLISIKLGSGLKSIGRGAFTFCHSLSSITIPDGVTSIGSSAFSSCDGLTSVVLGNGLISIEKSAFQYCDNLTSVKLPANITSLGNAAFFDCSSLTSAYFYGNAPAMGTSVFVYCASGFTVYYLSDKSGFTSPTWYGYPTAVFAPTGQCLITFDANGGTGGTGPAAMTPGEALTAPTVTREGYIFAGWTPAVPATVPEQDTVYTAQWDINLTDAVQFTVSNSEGVSGDIVSVSITISENSNIGAAKFELPFDPGLLEYVSATAGAALTSGMADINFDAVNNKIIMTYINSNGLTTGGSILDVQFRIKDGTPSQTINTNFAVVELTDSETAPLQSSITQGAIVVTYTLGDISGGGSVTVVDALMALQAASGKIILTGSQLLAADVNKDGIVSAVDALKILQYASGKIISF